MKIAKKVLAIALAVGMIFCLTAMAFASSFGIAASEIKVNKKTGAQTVEVTVSIKDGVGTKTVDTELTYDADKLEFMKAAWAASTNAAYTQIGSSLLGDANGTEPGRVLPGYAFAEEIFDAETFEEKWWDSGAEEDPTFDPNNVEIYTITFKIKEGATGKALISTGGASVEVVLTEEPAETTTAAPVDDETTTATPVDDETTTAALDDETTTVAPIADETTTAAEESTTAAKVEPKNEAANGAATGDTAVVAVAASVCALAAAAFVVTKKRK